MTRPPAGEDPSRPGYVGGAPAPGQVTAPAETASTLTDIVPANLQFCVPESGLAWQQADFADVWDRVRAGFGLDHRPGNARVAAEIDWFGSHQSYIDKVTDRASLYLYYVVQEIERHQLPMEVALLPIVESSYDPFAFSQGRAAGMWQFIASTGTLYGLKQNWWYDGRRDVKASTAAAIAYLSHLAKHYDGDWELALAAYNTGQGNVDRAIRRNRNQGKPTDFWSLKLPKETSAYVPRLLAVSRIVANPGAYGLALNPIPDEPYFATVDIGSQIDMNEAASLADISVEDLYRLNPGFNRWATDPRGPFELLVPVDRAAAFDRKLAQSAGGRAAGLQHYQVVRGDTLGSIARRHATDVKALQRINQLQGELIRPGQQLMIPDPAARPPAPTASAAAPKPKRVDYQVRKGDTLWELSRRFKVSLSDIATWNQLSPSSPLIAGTTLALWTPTADASQPGSDSAPLPAPYIRKVGYTVRRGDSLSEIATKFNVSLADILKWNPAHTAKHIRPGERLTLYVDITRFN